jgi:succinyl-CoA synthetase beta subunit
VRCDRIANGIIEATKKVSVNVPVVVRLDGTNAELARDILQQSGIEKLVTASDLNDGAEKAVKLVNA